MILENLWKELDNNKGLDNNKSKLGFGWGNFFIVMGFIQGSLALVLSVIMGYQNEYLPNRGIGLMESIWGLGGAYGLLKRKLFGLYFVYIGYFITILYGLFILFVAKESIFIFQGLGLIACSILFLIYFNKRKEMFS